ncbi:Golgi phosphoprotein 3-domain-containing protein [Blastocladiella britannica]|nr:Golgi phosphoprotein 3-domain-containing protein [Blastocladiella britannica]
MSSTPTSGGNGAASAAVFRRRGAAPAAQFSSDADLASLTPVPQQPPPLAPPPRSPPPLSSSSYSGGVSSVTSRTASGSLVAWDPSEQLLGSDRDVVPVDIRPPSPMLTLMDQLVLLGLKDRGYLSFWNDALSYVLRGCILCELALRGRIAMAPPAPLQPTLFGSFVAPAVCDRPVWVVDARDTGEPLLDEALRVMRQTQDGSFARAVASASAAGTGIGGPDYTTGSTSAKVPTSSSNGDSGLDADGISSSSGSAKKGEMWSVAQWMDLLSGETWSLSRASYQMRQVRERLSKGLVDKGVLRTGRRSFLVFDLATHPVADAATRDAVLTRVLNLLAVPRLSMVPDATLRDVCLVAAAHAGNVLENVLERVPGMAERETMWTRADHAVRGFAKWPDGAAAPVSVTIAGTNGPPPPVVATVNGVEVLEVVAGVLAVFARMDSLA